MKKGLPEKAALFVGGFFGDWLGKKTSSSKR